MIGAENWNIIVVPYNPNWVSEFKRIEGELLVAIKDEVLSIEHVGSTSVEGLHAKPIIDIDIVVENDLFSIVTQKLKEIDYEHVGDLGITGREAFSYKNKEHLMEHHLYVCNKESKELKRHVTFRNYLRTHADERDRYSQIKIEMAKKFPNDIDNYLLGKESVILDIYKKCGLL
ncbi:GrpB family protein [Flavobacterium sp. LS1R47]|uniref:GrpB family protein n=1 Tax=Flavobacterium frigoritolerans TaxID=2987686 RepID=A0A9X3HM86_9FLAO|nr:GrpB family protein [Flavobacterium frigoritolerans]MCV9933980.1 GrpB family protein [Flavobacterium frigoritolerans]